ncbi:MAG: class I SAM-dependent methyltransferase [Steroidobacteraceae bacterium]
MPGNELMFERRVLPRFMAANGRPPATSTEVRQLMTQDGYYQFWSATQRLSQEMMWSAVADSVEQTDATLATRADESASRRTRPLGSLRLDSGLPIPRYHVAADIHLQPGGYHSDRGAGDVASGALYERALSIYQPDSPGLLHDGMGRFLSDWYARQFAERRPERILDMGCGIGNNSVAWARRYPEADLQAIDVAAPMLRYGHQRSQELGIAVNFSQQNAEQTDFATASFDLVLSHIMLHETSRLALGNILRECHRLLRPGGIMLHLEIPRGDTPFEKFMYNWETYNNNETFAGYLTEADLAAHAVQAGFAPDATSLIGADPGAGKTRHLYSRSFRWKILCAQR